MYRIRLYDSHDDLEGFVIHSPYANDLKADFEIELVLDGVSSMNFTINPKNPAWGKIKTLRTLIKVFNTKTNKKIFDGRVLMPTEKMNTNGHFSIKYICEDKKAYLNDSRQRYKKVQNTSVAGFFSLLIEQHNSSVPPHKRFKVGNVTVGNTSENIYRFIGYGTTMEEIQDDLIDRFGGHLVLREEDDGTYIDYLAEVGEVKNAPIKLRNNLQDMQREIDPTNIITRLIPLGAQMEAAEGETEDVSMPRVDIKIVNNGIDYLEDADLIEEFGIIEGTIELDIQTPSLIKKHGEEFLQNQRAARISYDIGALNMYLVDNSLDDYEVGDWYPLDNPVYAIKDNLQVIGKKIKGDSPQKSSLVIGEKHVSLTQYQVIANKTARKSQELQKVVDRQVQVITNLHSRVENVNKVVDTINIQIGEADLPGLNQTIFELNEAITNLNGVVESIPDYGLATPEQSGLMSVSDKTKLDQMDNYVEATPIKSGLFSASDKTKLDLIAVTQSINLNELVQRIVDLEGASIE